MPPKKCNVCKGNCHVTVRMRGDRNNPRDSLDVLGICVCPACNGKGVITEQDRQRVQSVEMYEQIVD